MGAPVTMLRATAAALLGAAGGLLLATVVPVLFGWSSSIVLTGSMRPAVEPGDVVVTSPLRADRVPNGSVIRFHVPGRPGRAVLHRVVRVTDDGLLITKGDANATADHTPVPSEAVTGVGRWRVPYIGLPVVWWTEGRYPWVVLTAVALTVLCALVPRRARSRRSGRRPS